MGGTEQPLFDLGKARGARSGPDVGEGFTPETPAAPMTVSRLVARIKSALAETMPEPVVVVGELSNVKPHSSGHLYFRLKDANAAIDAVMFRQHASRLKFTPTDGLEVIVDGRVDVYEVRGQLQLYVERMTPKGTGALELAFRQLQEKLRAEGLFDPSAKKPIARFPRAVGVVTSSTGAAIRDIRRTIGRRWPGLPVYLLPTPVQGEGAAEKIAQALRLLDANARRYRIDTIIVARGGGSIEDLWAFNEESVARAIFAAVTPVVSGVGHEVDVTIADLVADVRAATPTAAAELAVPDAAEVRAQILQLGRRLSSLVAERARASRASLAAVLRSFVFRDPTARLRTQTQRLDELSHRLRAGTNQVLSGSRRRLQPTENRLAACHPARMAERAAGRLDKLTNRLAWVLGGRSKAAGDCLAGLEKRLWAVHPSHRLRLARQQIGAAARQLEAMSYRKVLHRGYSVTRGAEGVILRSVRDVREGGWIETELVDGRMDSKVGRRKATKDSEQTPPGAEQSAPKRSPRAGRQGPQESLFD